MTLPCLKYIDGFPLHYCLHSYHGPQRPTWLGCRPPFPTSSLTPWSFRHTGIFHFLLHKGFFPASGPLHRLFALSEILFPVLHPSHSSRLSLNSIVCCQDVLIAITNPNPIGFPKMTPCLSHDTVESSGVWFPTFSLPTEDSEICPFQYSGYIIF